MPYIPQDWRKNLDGQIEALAKAVAGQVKDEKDFAGTLNYTMTRLVLLVIKERFGKLRYWIIAAVTGAFKNASDEFYRRVGVPYEDKKIASDGDVEEYKDIL